MNTRIRHATPRTRSVNSPPFPRLHNLQWKALLSGSCLIDVPGQPAIYIFPDDEADALMFGIRCRVVIDSIFEAGRYCWLLCVNWGELIGEQSLSSGARRPQSAELLLASRIANRHSKE